MENLVVNTAAYNDGTAKKPNAREKEATLTGIAGSFQELITKSGVQFDNSLNALTDRAGINSIVQPSDSAQHHDDAYSRPEHDNRDGMDNHRANDDRGANSDDHTRADQHDDHRVERPNDGGENRGEARSDHRDGNRDEPRTERAERQEAAPRESERAESHDNSGNGNAETGTGETAEQTNAQNQNGAGNQGESQAQTGGPGTQAAVQQVAAAAGHVDLNFNAALADNAQQAESGQVAETGKGPILESLAATAQNGAKRQGVHSGPAAQNQANAQAAQAANAGAKQAEDAGAKQAGSNVLQQAAEIAKSAGGNQRMQVNVAVTDDGDTLVSKPTSALNTTSVIAADGKGQSQGGQNSGGNHGAGQQNAAIAANAQQAQAGQNRAQAKQNAAQATQAQASGNAGGTAHAGGEGTQSNAANSATQGQQTQQAQKSAESQTQPQTQNRATLPGSSVVDQVSVKITKALQAGSDRINVQLRPAELGRVEVKVELAHDGRAMAIVTADNKDTLDLLRRDSSDLQRALADAGLDLNSSDLEFNLRGEQGQMAEEQGSGDPASDDPDATEETDALDDGVMLAHEGGVLANGRIDVRA